MVGVYYFYQVDNVFFVQCLRDVEDELSGFDNLFDKEEVLERFGELRNDINRG